ncbi:MAG: tetratricopeptide repeat protein [Thermoplasmata archaeon]|nr:tetratricopeptide repeat protein [Thermoplasmata archaeon]
MSAVFVAREKEHILLKQYVDAALTGEAGCVLIGGEAGIGKTTLVSKLTEYAVAKNYKVLAGYCVKDAIVPYMSVREALRTAGLESLVVDKPPPKLECAYFMNDAGLLVSKYERAISSLDSDIFAGMITAVNNFVRDTLSMLDKKETEEHHALNRLGYGDWTILINKGQAVNLVAIVRGEPDEFLKEDMEEVHREVEKEFGEVLKNWRGDVEKVQRIDEILKSMVGSGKYDGIDYSKELDDPKLKLNRIYENILSGLRREAKRNPLFLFIDDLQWADPSTLALIHYLARNLRNLPVLLIGTYRTEDITTGWDGKPHPLAETIRLMDREGLVKKIELSRFTKEETLLLLEAHFGKIKYLEESFLDTIYRETEGNPLFILEVFKLLLEERVIFYDDNQQQYILEKPLDINKIKIPEKVQSVIEYRINHLEEAHRDILEIAAVEGEHFHSKTIEHVAGMPRITVLKMLNTLEREYKLIHPAGDQYRFDHTKIRETIYESLNPELRKEYHGLIASYIEEQHRGNLDAVAPMLGIHYYSAGLKERALPHLLAAGNRALENFAVREAASFYRHAIECIEKEKQRDRYVECLEKLGEIHGLNGNYENAIACFSEAIEELKRIQLPDLKKLGVLHRRIGEVYEKMGRFDEAMNFCTKAEELVAGESREMSIILSFEGLVYMRKGEYDRALEKLEKALEMCRRDENKKEIGLIYRRMGTIRMYLGDDKEAINLLTQSLEISEDINDIEGIGKSSNNLGIVYYGKGELDLALKNFEKSMEIAKKIGDTYGIGLSYINIGSVHFDKGDLDQALRFYEKGLVIKERIGDTHGVALIYNALGSIYMEKWDFGNAERYLTRSVVLRENIGDSYGLSLSYINLGNLCKRMNKMEEAKTYYEKALGIAEKSGSKELLCVGFNGLAEVLAKQQKLEKALECVGKAGTIVSEIGSESLEAEYRRTLGIVRREEGLFEDAEAAFEKALSLYWKMNMLLEFAKTCYEYCLMLLKQQKPGNVEKAMDYLGKALKISSEKNTGTWSDKFAELLQHSQLSGRQNGKP